MWKDLYAKWFCYSKHYWYKNIFAIPKFIKELFVVIKRGYPYQAVYNNCDWFIDIEKHIIEDLILNHSGYPNEFCKYNTEEDPDAGSKEWENILQHMCELLKIMEKNRIAISIDQCQKINNAKNEFFELFSKYFFNLWD